MSYFTCHKLHEKLFLGDITNYSACTTYFINPVCGRTNLAVKMKSIVLVLQVDK